MKIDIKESKGNIAIIVNFTESELNEVTYYNQRSLPSLPSDLDSCIDSCIDSYNDKVTINNVYTHDFNEIIDFAINKDKK